MILCRRAYFLLALVILVLLGQSSWGQAEQSGASWDDAGRCGTNALFVFVNFFKDIPYENVAKAVEVSAVGSSLSSLADASENLGVSVHPISVTKQELASVSPPYVMHLDLVEQGGIGHFVTVFDHVNLAEGLFIQYIDGGDGVIKRSNINSLSASFSGFLLVPHDDLGWLKKLLILVIAFFVGMLFSSRLFGGSGGVHG